MDFGSLLATYQERINTVLPGKLPSVEVSPVQLHTALHYAVLNGGKRIRPFLVYATGELFGTPLEQLDDPACAIELIHAYSLVHDDLPCMDNDDLRRGKPTCHKAFDEATAILVGDALQSLAFQLLANAKGITAPTKIAMIQELSASAGSLGLVGGQALDLEAAGKKIELFHLEKIHRMKTGALIATSIKLGLLAAHVSNESIHISLDRYARNLGLCFQIKDDILDVEGETSVLGKKQGSDSASAKATYASLQSIAFAKQKLHQLHTEALESLACLGREANVLSAFADYVVQRTY